MVSRILFCCRCSREREIDRELMGVLVVELKLYNGRMTKPPSGTKAFADRDEPPQAPGAKGQQAGCLPEDGADRLG